MVVNKKEYSIHRKVWSDSHGEIPAGRHIHHADGDHSNNTLENLQCVTRKEHGKIHQGAGTDIDNGGQLFAKGLRERKSKIMRQTRFTIKDINELDNLAFVEYMAHKSMLCDDAKFIEYLKG